MGSCKLLELGCVVWVILVAVNFLLGCCYVLVELLFCFAWDVLLVGRWFTGVGLV